MDKFEDFTLDYNEKSKKFTKSFIDNIGLVMGAVIVLAVIVIMTADIRLISARELASIGLDFFLLIFCSYAMYICCADTGTKNGLATETYTSVKKRIDELKAYIVAGRMQSKLTKFCKHYTDEEIVRVRTYNLSTVGIDYEDYATMYMFKDEDYIDSCTELTKLQKKVIKETNEVKPIRLTAEMLMGGIRDKARRSPLEMNPNAVKKADYIAKFFQIAGISILMSVMAFDVVTEPSWAVFASVCTKLVSIITQGFSGYKTGYDNIVIDTVGYIESQCNVLQQGIQYIEAEEIVESMSEPLPALPATK